MNFSIFKFVEFVLPFEKTTPRELSVARKSVDCTYVVINQQWLDNERSMFSVVMCWATKITIIYPVRHT